MKHRDAKHRRSGSDSDSPPETTPEDAVVPADVNDGTPHRHGPHHDPTVHTERELYAVTTQRCRGEYP